ncbi:MAG: Gfo/Idh/MocA family oxidoreductase [Gemmatimonadetes bacterium]|jgi:predicted dehydrogenase|nr:Gfo/Idh/MocA family oxidoreductase [Gemmatimonadota bacterium]MBT7858862.1 Gfo/Idh/MocA family oxidoreductase [Gemmatimonadota bacterium]
MTLTVGIIGCGRMGQQYVEVYDRLADTEVIAIAEIHADRRRVVGERFGVDALYADAAELFAHVTPDLAVVVLPGKYIRDAVIAAARAGVKGVSTDKPIGAVPADVDAMVEACAEAGTVFAGGNLQRAMTEVQQAAARLRSGEFGPVIGASVHGFGGEISGGGCQHIAVLRLLAGAEITEVVAWGEPEEALHRDVDEGLLINGQFRLSNGVVCPVYAHPTPLRGVDVWTATTLVRWDWAPPQIFQGFDESGHRLEIDPAYTPADYPEYTYLGTTIQSFVDVVQRGLEYEEELFVSGRDLGMSMEVAIAAKHSALWGSVPVSLPLVDRSLTLYPRTYRWLGGDEDNLPQPLEEAAGTKA